MVAIRDTHLQLGQNLSCHCLRLSRTDAKIELLIRDDGVGFYPAKVHHRSFGLRIMEYRSKLIEGALSIQSTPGMGTEVSCKVEVNDEPRTEENLSGDDR